MLHNVIVGVRGRVTSGAYREGDYKVKFFRIVKTIFLIEQRQSYPLEYN